MKGLFSVWAGDYKHEVKIFTGSFDDCQKTYNFLYLGKPVDAVLRIIQEPNGVVSLVKQEERTHVNLDADPPKEVVHE